MANPTVQAGMHTDRPPHDESGNLEIRRNQAADEHVAAPPKKAIDKTDWVVGRVLARHAVSQPDRLLATFLDGRRLTYGEAFELCHRVARGLRSLGIRKGDRVAVMLPNTLEYLAAWFAINELGAIVVAVNTAYEQSFLVHVLAGCGAKIVICDGEYVSRFVAVEAHLPNVRRLLVTESGTARLEAARLKAYGFSRIEAMPFATVISRDATPVEPPEGGVTYRDIATIMYTSGTTGLSKGVLMPHAHDYLLGLGAVGNLGLTQGDIYYIAMPLFHANAMFMQLYATLIAGAHAVIVPKFSASRWIDDIAKYGVTVTNTIGVMTQFILQQPERPGDGATALRRVLAVPTPAEIAPAFRKRFNVAMGEGYGMTEVNMPLYMPLGEPPRDGSCGKPLADYFDVRIADPETDEPLPPGAVGEILVRPKEPFAFNAGYDGQPDKTVEAWRNFWFHTGDAGRTDDEGYFYFVDRIKDCIRRRGENISSYEIEAAIQAHPAVAEVAVVAVPSNVAGGEDEVKACVVVAAGESLDAADVAAFCEGRVPAFAIPRYVELLAALPRTTTEKVRKTELRTAGVTPSTWDREAAKRN